MMPTKLLKLHFGDGIIKDVPLKYAFRNPARPLYEIGVTGILDRYHVGGKLTSAFNCFCPDFGIGFCLPEYVMASQTAIIAQSLASVTIGIGIIEPSKPRPSGHFAGGAISKIHPLT